MFGALSSKYDCNLALHMYTMSFLIAEKTLEQARRQSSLCTTQLSFYVYNIVPDVLPVSVRTQSNGGGQV